MSILMTANLPPALSRHEIAALEAMVARAKARARQRRHPHHGVWATALMPLLAMLVALATGATVS